MKTNYNGVTISRVKQTPEIIEPLSAELTDNMRKEDEEEQRAFGLDPFIAVKLSAELSKECYAARAGKTLLMLFGITETEEDVFIWALGTEAVKEHKKALVACGLDYIRDALKKYGRVCNYISLENKPALRFIKRAGAKFGEVNSLEDGTEFVRFDLEV